MAFTDAALQEAQARLSSRDPMGVSVLESRDVLAWRLADLNAAEAIATAHRPADGLREDAIKDILARMRDPNEEPTAEEVFEAYITSWCDDAGLRHPDEAWADFVPECDGEEPCRWSFDPDM